MAYDVVIVGSGYAGANLAYLLAQKGKEVLILEAGPGLPNSREDYMENFYLNTFKSPSSPYPPNANTLDPAHTNVPRPTIQALVEAPFEKTKSYFTYTPGSLPFASTYQRLAGGTGNHWMGTCLRMTNADLATNKRYGVGLDWPLSYEDLEDYYGQAEHLIGVSSDVTEQETIGTEFPIGYEYPMRKIAPSYWDNHVKTKVTGAPLTNESYFINQTLITQTPAGRNSEPYQGRRVCQGNTNCTPICPIQAKYDPQFTLGLALDTGKVTLVAKRVVDYLTVDTSGDINGVHYIEYEDVEPGGRGQTGTGTATGTIYVLAAHAVENAKILLLSSDRNGGKNVANSSDLVGHHLMDHPAYLVWGLANDPVYPYRGPISTSGIESLRDGEFRNNANPAGRAPWRIELGNEGWNWPMSDPYTTGMDYIYGTNKGGINSSDSILGNMDYVNKMTDLLTRQFRIAFLIEQPADPANRVQLSTTETDNLGIPRPLITYNLSTYVKKGFERAREAAKEFFSRLGGVQHTVAKNGAAKFTYNGTAYDYNGAGHLCGTHVMGEDSTSSVVDSYQKSWDHKNLYLVGCGSMPSIGTQNPTLTMLALVCRTAEKIDAELT